MRALLTALTASLLVACAPVPGDGGVYPVIPILANDPDDLVQTMEWGRSPALEKFPSTEMTVLELLDESTPEVVRVAVDGGACPPTVQAQVTGSPKETTIELVLGGAIAPEGFECSEILTTHELIITFNQPIDLDGLRVSARRTGSG